MEGSLIPGTFMSGVLRTFIPQIQTLIFRCEYVVLVWPHRANVRISFVLGCSAVCYSVLALAHIMIRGPGDRRVSLNLQLLYFQWRSTP